MFFKNLSHNSNVLQKWRRTRIDIIRHYLVIYSWLSPVQAEALVPLYDILGVVLRARFFHTLRRITRPIMFVSLHLLADRSRASHIFRGPRSSLYVDESSGYLFCQLTTLRRTCASSPTFISTQPVFYFPWSSKCHIEFP